MKKLLFVIAIAISFTACKKGDTGDPGPAGANGNANVKSFSFSVTPGQWLIAGTAGQTDHWKYVELIVPEITADILNNGAVLSYMTQTGYIIPLPFSVPASTSINANFLAAYTPGIAEVDIQLSNFQTPNTSAGNYEFKIVVADGIARLKNPVVNWNSYEDVARKFNLD